MNQCLGEKRGYLFLVADGIGGHAAGDKASRLAVEGVVQYMLEVTRLDLQDELNRIPEKCHTRIRTEAARAPGCHNMGTTLTLAYVIWPRLYVVHVGDSRCYLFRSADLEQITTDHTWMQQFVDQGLLPREAARRSRWKYALWNALGGNSDDFRPEVRKLLLQAGDTLLLCSDGLTESLADDEIREILRSDTSPRSVCERLMQAANDAGGRDNITVVAAQFR